MKESRAIIIVVVLLLLPVLYVGSYLALVVPLMLTLGYDRMVAATVILLGAGVGTMGSTINPFATGVASGAAPLGPVLAPPCARSSTVPVSTRRRRR